MRLIFLSCIVLLLLAPTTNSQVIINGKIIDSATGKPLEFVNVFLANTTIGTTTEKNGEFSLNNVPFGSYDIIFSYVGYETEKKNFSAYKPQRFNYDISLKPVPINLGAVNVTGTVPEDWRYNLNKFVKIFIGKTANAKKTNILNPEVMNFADAEQTNIFKAYSDSTLRIKNKALGYMLYINMEGLEYAPDGSIKCKYYTRFKELTPESEDEQHAWENNRKKTYLISQKHFFYDLIHKQLNKDYFPLRSRRGRVISPEQLYITCNPDSNTYVFAFQGWLVIKDASNQESDLHFHSPNTLIDKYGNILNAFGNVETGGYWGDQRIADILPLNYVYNEK
jgi:hypothetical protein